MSGTIVICNPVAPAPPMDAESAPRPSAVAGKRVGFRVNEWESYDVFMHEMETILREEFGASSVRWWINRADQTGGQTRAARAAGPEHAEQIKAFAAESDWAIMGLAA